MNKKTKYFYRRMLLLIICLVTIGVAIYGITSLVKFGFGKNLDSQNKTGRISEDGKFVVDSDNKIGKIDKNNKDTENKEDIIITMNAVGDIMFHPKQIWGGFDKDLNTFDYKPYFQHVKPILEKSDITVGNFEGTACGNDIYKYQGYPLFNAPDEALDAIKNAGFDVLCTINNHSLDTRKTGVIRTIEKLDERNISHVGTYKDKPETRVLMKDVKGIKIAFIAYTEMLNGLETVMTAQDLDDMINVIDKEKIKEDIKDAKEKDADLIVAFMHWGYEYHRKPNDIQKELKDFLLDQGVNIILGSHPHVIQNCSGEMYNDKKVYVAYSMGNFISNQRREECNLDEQTEDGVIINFSIKKSGKTGETTIESVSYNPTWVYREWLSDYNKYSYRILPVLEFMESEDYLTDSKTRMKRSYKDTMKQVSTSFNN